MKYFVALLIFVLPFLTYGQKWTTMIKDPDANFYEVQKEFYKTLEESGKEKIPGFKQFKRWEYFMETRVDTDGVFRHHNQANIVYRDLVKNSHSKLNDGTAGQWSQLGPFGAPTNSGSGRANCIAYHPTNPNILLLGSASGGLWRSVNGGQSWTSNTDGLENLGFSDIVFSESNPNIVYAATGDRDGGDTYSVGILKSFDGGLSWQTTGLTFTQNAKRKIYKLLVHPSNDSIVYMASTTGFRISVDGGMTWTLKRAGSFIDAAFKPNDPNTIYAATSSVVIKSTNAGQSWTILSVPFSSSNSRITLGVTPANSDYLYILAAKSSDNGFGGLYRSTDAGATFTLRSSTPNVLGWASNGNDSGGQGWYDLALGVSRTNPNLILVGGINIWRSPNGGSSWSLSGHWTGSGADYVHADIHDIEFSPHNSTSVWACTDGGVSLSTNNGTNWNEYNTNLSIAQIYRLGTSSTNASKIITGWQDNGTNLMSGSSWAKALGGDGMECIIDYSNNNYMYGSLYYGNIRRTTNGGANWVDITDDINEYGAWVTPYVQDPNSAATLYAGFNNIYKTTNRGNSWTQLTNLNTGATFSALAIAPSNSNIIYAATYYNLYKTTNGGQSWTNLSVGSSGITNMTYIAVHPTNPNRVWLTQSGYTDGNKVYYSADGGQSWQNISGSLPNLPANTIVYEKNSPDGIYVGMDVGVYYLDSTLSDWKPFMKNLPNVIVKELEFFYPGQKIRAATYGRGVWESPVHSIANSLEEENYSKNEINISIRPNPSNGVFEINKENGIFINTKMELFNQNGQLLRQFMVSNTQNYKIDLGEYNAGIYILHISDNKSFSVKKIILQ